MKNVKRVMLILPALAAFVALTSAVASAQTPITDDPTTAVGIDNQTHSIAANDFRWYAFNYAGDNSLIVVDLVNGKNSGLLMNVYTPDQIADDWWHNPPIGRGTTPSCGARHADNGTCNPLANDSVWTGKFFGGGTYYVQIQNLNNQATPVTLTVQGTGVGPFASSAQIMTNPSNTTTTQP